MKYYTSIFVRVSSYHMLYWICYIWYAAYQFWYNILYGSYNINNYTINIEPTSDYELSGEVKNEFWSRNGLKSSLFVRKYFSVEHLTDEFGLLPRHCCSSIKWKSVSKAGQAVEASWYFEIWLFGSPNFDFTEVLRFLYLLKISGTSKSVFPSWKSTVKQYLFTLRLKSSSFCFNNRNFEDGNKCWHRCWRIVTCQNEALSLKDYRKNLLTLKLKTVILIFKSRLY